MLRPMSEPVGIFGGFTEPSAEKQAKARNLRDANELIAAGFEMLGALKPAGRGLHSTADGRLWRRGLGMDHGRNPDAEAFAVAADMSPVWFERPTKGPTTVEELEAQKVENAKAAREAERERERERKRKRAQAVPVTLDNFEEGPALTLRAAGEQVTNLGGKVELVNDRLVVSLPRSALGGLTSGLAAARRLYLAEAEVVACLKAKRELPTRAVLPTGALAPE